MEKENTGFFFRYAKSNGEYAEYEFDLAEYIKSGMVNLIVPWTDMPDLFEIVDHWTREGQFVDLFESKVLKDAFLMTLKYIMADTGFPEELEEKVRNWYFNNPQYEVLTENEPY